MPSTLNLNKRIQTITFTSNPNPAYINNWYQPTATGGGSGNRRPQSITFTPALPAEAFLDSTVTVAATGGESGNPVTFSVLTPATCSLSGTAVRMTSVGPCTVAADQAGDAIHGAARQTATIAVRYKFTGFVGLSASPAVNQATATHGQPDLHVRRGPRPGDFRGGLAVGRALPLQHRPRGGRGRHADLRDARPPGKDEPVHL